MRLFSQIAILIVLVSASFVASADTIVAFTNFGANFDVNSLFIDEGSPVGSYVSVNVVMAPEFTPIQTVTLSSVLIAASQYTGNTPLNLYIESASGNAPGAILDSLTQLGSITPGPDLVRFACTSCTTLDAGTAYFLVAQQSDVNNASIWYNNPSGPTSILYFNEINSLTGPWFGLEDPTPALFEVDGTTGTTATTPELSTFALFSTGLAGILGIARRRFSSHG